MKAVFVLLALTCAAMPSPANATYFDSHTTDKTSLLTFAMDLTPLTRDDQMCPIEYSVNYVKRLERDVNDRLKRFM